MSKLPPHLNKKRINLVPTSRLQLVKKKKSTTDEVSKPDSDIVDQTAHLEPYTPKHRLSISPPSADANMKQTRNTNNTD